MINNDSFNPYQLTKTKSSVILPQKCKTEETQASANKVNFENFSLSKSRNASKKNLHVDSYSYHDNKENIDTNIKAPAVNSKKNILKQGFLPKIHIKAHLPWMRVLKFIFINQMVCFIIENGCFLRKIDYLITYINKFISYQFTCLIVWYWVII